MKLVVRDVGNTSTAVGLWTDGRVSNTHHIDSAPERAEKAVLRLARGGVDGIAYASVVPKQNSRWEKFAKSANIRFHKISHRDFSRGRQDITLDYPKPATIGPDRLADASAAVSRYGAPVLVMDFGTALTAAVVTADHVWRGGVIAPGFPLMRDYLFERTAKLPKMVLGRGTAPKIGRSTTEAMRFGALVGYRGMVREIVLQLKKNFASDFNLVATGGYAKWALSGLDLDFKIDPTLTLYGVGLVASRVMS